jgi:carbonic anhydrase
VQAVEVHDHILNLMDRIFPAVLASREQPGDPVNNAVTANVELIVRQLEQSWPTLHEMARNGELEVIGAIYDLESGCVEWLE